MKSKVYVGAGYRELDTNEIVQAGDEYYACNVWSKTKCCGYRVSVAGNCYDGTHLTYRRKVEIGVGSGYRELDSWEVLQAGDEYLSCGLYWQPVTREGFLPLPTLKYRRLSPPVHPAWKDAPYPPQVYYYATDSDGTKWTYIPDNPTTKPPLGLMPKSIWLETRRDEVRAAIRRYADAGFDIPHEWITESLAFELN